MGGWLQFPSECVLVFPGLIASPALCLPAGLGTSSTRKPLNTAGVTTPACAQSAACASHSWTRRPGWPRTTATSGWRRGIEAQVSHATPGMCSRSGSQPGCRLIWDCPGIPAAWVGVEVGQAVQGAWNTFKKLNCFCNSWHVPRGWCGTLKPHWREGAERKNSGCLIPKRED